MEVLQILNIIVDDKVVTKQEVENIDFHFEKFTTVIDNQKL